MVTASEDWIRLDSLSSSKGSQRGWTGVLFSKDTGGNGCQWRAFNCLPASETACLIRKDDMVSRHYTIIVLVPSCNPFVVSSFLVVFVCMAEIDD